MGSPGPLGGPGADRRGRNVFLGAGRGGDGVTGAYRHDAIGNATGVDSTRSQENHGVDPGALPPGRLTERRVGRPVNSDQMIPADLNTWSSGSP